MVVLMTSHSGHHFSLLIQSDALSELLQSWHGMVGETHLPCLYAIGLQRTDLSFLMREVVRFVAFHAPASQQRVRLVCT